MTSEIKSPPLSEYPLVIEELEIAPDLIIGTSMGSVVGGLYAAGWTPDQIEELVE